MGNEKEKKVLILSDGTGETAAQMLKAAKVQFGDQKFHSTRYKNVRNEAQIDAICDEAADQKYLLLYTLVSPELRAFLHERATQKGIPTVDLLGPLLMGLRSYFGHEPKLEAGILHHVNDDYFQRIDAMEYTMAHDDGRESSDLDQADLVILGISRTSKTPLSMYLSHQGWRVANIPMIMNFEIPRELSEVDPRRVIGLTIDPEELVQIRQNRLQRLGQKDGGNYAAPQRVYEEVEYANEIFRKNRKWAVFNVTGKALEETASEIMRLMAARRISPSLVKRK